MTRSALARSPLARNTDTATATATGTATGTDGGGGRSIYRHRLPVRLWHWLNVVAITGLFMSGLMIFNAHPRLYWGHYGANADPAWLEISGRGGPGRLIVGGAAIPTDGVLGRSGDGAGGTAVRAFPRWLTLPGDYDLAGGRRYHLFFAWLFAVGFALFFLWSIVSRHASRDVTPRLAELAPRHLAHEVADHARLRFPTGAAAARFNSLQKISYFAVLFILLPAMILTGLAMSPGMDANAPLLVDLFGGRQSARSVHFISCWLLAGFTLVHLAMVVLAGPVNEMRSMITGWFRLPPARLPPARLPPESRVP